MARVKKITSITVAIVFSIMVWGCGSSETNSSNPNTSSTPTDWHDMFHSETYSGVLALKFKSTTDVSFNGKSLVSPKSTTDVDSVNETVAEHGGSLKKVIDLPDETIDKALERAEREEKSLRDWSLYFKIEALDPYAAESMFAELRQNRAIEWIYPIPTTVPASLGDVGGGAGDGTLTEQLYLESEEASGGVNVHPAWNEGVNGEGVRIIDEEYNWNFDHEALPIDESDMIWQADIDGGIDINDSAVINHGTAVVGVLGAMEETNTIGLHGMAPGSDIRVIRTEPSSFSGRFLHDMLSDYAAGNTLAPDESGFFVRPGDIIVTPIAARLYDYMCDWDPSTVEEGSCNVALEAFRLDFDAIHDLSELGVIVVEGAGNGSLNLDNFKSLQEEFVDDCSECPDLSVEDSGAIMVAASNGYLDNTKPWWSNWGSRVDTYAWGYDVVTAGYGDINPPQRDPDDPNSAYTSNFNGTSSATAIVGGALALVQSFTKKYYRENIVDHREVYLDSYHMKQLLSHPDASYAGDPEYQMGRKPNVAGMIELVRSGYVIPHLGLKNETLIPKGHAVSGIRYDMDKDNRADLIVFDEGIVKVDLSSIEPSGGCQGYLPAGTYCPSCGPETNWELPEGVCDNYGEWDLEMEITGTMNEDGVFFPVVSDYDSDGDADIGIYDSKNGYWYIKYITSEHLTKTTLFTTQWDEVVNYSVDPSWKSFGRPLVGDYNNDNWLDLVVVADGHWLIDFGGIGRLEKVGADIQYFSPFEGFEKDVKFLTDEQLAAAPGWAYLPVATGSPYNIIYKSPDSVEAENLMYTIQTTDEFLSRESFTDSWLRENSIESTEFNYGDNSRTSLPVNKHDRRLGSIHFNSSANLEGFEIFDFWNYTLNVEEPSWLTEDHSVCKPVTADFNKDQVDDLALICPSGIKIAYYEHEFLGSEDSSYHIVSERIVNIETGALAIPPTVYPGGMKYETIRSILERYDLTEEYRDKDPFAPHTVNCIKNWAVQPPYCLAQ